MNSIPLLDELAVIAGIGVLITLILARLRLPTVAGLLLAGALIGPFGLKWVSSIHAIELLAEVGVVLLLFTIGLEFSLKRLRHIFSQVALGGLLQVLLTILATVGVAALVGEPARRGVLLGFIFALSSTAIVLRALSERHELDAPHGRFIVGTLIFQDLCVVPMVLIVPILGKAGGAGSILGQVGLAMLKAALVVVATVLVSRLLVPRVLRWVDASRSREVFLLAVLGLCIGTAWLTSLAGLSLALGAFLGGMVVADTEYGHRAMGDMLPLRDAFVSVFFISLGMLFDLRVVRAHPIAVALLLLGLLLGKGILATVSALAMRFPARVAWLAGVGLAQFGEFGFVLARLGESSGAIEPEVTSQLLAAGILSMFLTPALVRVAPHVSAGERLLGPLAKLLGARSIAEAHLEKEAHSQHVVVVGHGVAGQLVARALGASHIPFVVLEINAESVRTGRSAGIPIYYADATSAEALGHAHLERARALVLLMNDPRAAQRVVDTARRVAPDVPIIMRARYLGEREELFRIGALEVIAEEVEGGVELLSRLLRLLGVPRNVIETRVREVREVTQPSEQPGTGPRRRLIEHPRLADLRIEAVTLTPASRAVGSSPAELNIRSYTRALVIAVDRGGTLLEAPDPREPLRAGDTVFLVGSLEAVQKARQLLGGDLSASISARPAHALAEGPPQESPAAPADAADPADPADPK
ncbi:MAG: cation:proton antiporter [Polyangia bacterium]